MQPSPLGTGGRIIFISATIHYSGIPFQTHVAVAKAGIDALSNNIALEFGPLGITSNIIAPGPIANTEVSPPTVRGYIVDGCLLTFDITMQGVDRLLPSDAIEQAIRAQPLGRFGSVRDIADSTVFLFSDSGSYVSGQVLVGM